MEYLYFYKKQTANKIAKNLNLSPASIFFIYAFISFGGLCILHFFFDKTQIPSSWKHIFLLPTPGTYYYPSLWSFIFDLTVSPLIIFMLIWTPRSISNQLQKLSDENRIKEKQNISWLSSLITESKYNLLAAEIISALVGLFVFTSGVIKIVQSYSSSPYAISFANGLSFLQAYSIVFIAFNFIYLAALLGRYDIEPKIHMSHPDNCGGLKPFGELAKLVYYFIFIEVTVLAIISASNDSFTFLRRIDSESSTIIQLLIVLVFFPLAIAWIFYYFIYIPHAKLEEVKQQYMCDISRLLTTKSLSDFYKTKENDSISELSELEQDYIKKASDEDLTSLYEKIKKIPSWPIEKRFYKKTFLLINPILPTLITIGNDIINPIFEKLFK